MSEEPKVGPGPKPAKSAERRARLKQALRANLLKRKGQAKTKQGSPRTSDEGRQS
jgi:hypothetical protein